MSHDLVSAIKALRKGDRVSIDELAEAILELERRVQNLQREVDDLRRQ